MISNWIKQKVVVNSGLILLAICVLIAITQPSPFESSEFSTLTGNESTQLRGKLVAIAQTAAQTPLDQSLDRENLEPAKRDPFLGEEVITPSLAIKKPSIPMVALPIITPPLPPPPALAPALNLRFVGRMTGPDGIETVYASLGDVPVTLTLGLSLSNGYRVEAIKERVVEMRYIPLDTTARLELPEPSKYDIR